jgi:hypothetical protein
MKLFEILFRIVFFVFLLIMATEFFSAVVEGYNKEMKKRSPFVIDGEPEDWETTQERMK